MMKTMKKMKKIKKIWERKNNRGKVREERINKAQLL